MAIRLVISEKSLETGASLAYPKFWNIFSYYTWYVDVS